MVLSTETDADLEDKHTELCNKLNLDSKIANEAWELFQSISKNFTLEVCICPLISLLIFKIIVFL